MFSLKGNNGNKISHSKSRAKVQLDGFTNKIITKIIINVFIN